MHYETIGYERVLCVDFSIFYIFAIGSRRMSRNFALVLQHPRLTSPHFAEITRLKNCETSTGDEIARLQLQQAKAVAECAELVISYATKKP